MKYKITKKFDPLRIEIILDTVEEYDEFMNQISDSPNKDIINLSNDLYEIGVDRGIREE